MYVSPGNGSAVRMNANLLLIHAVAAQRRARRARRARTPARGRCSGRSRGRRRPCSPPARARRTRPARSAGRATSARSGATTARSDPQVTEALALAWRARRALDVPGALAARVARAIDRCARQRSMALPLRRRQPVQLERAALRRRGRGHGPPRPPAPRLPPLPAPLHRRDPAAGARAGRRQPRAGLRVPLLARPAAARAAQLRHAGVREHRRLRAALVRAAPCGPGMRPLPAADLRLAARVDHAPARRRLDARRLPELGHRLRAGPLALRAVLGVRAAGPARDRGRARAVGQSGLRLAGRRRCSTAACCSTTAGRARPMRRSRRG